MEKSIKVILFDGVCNLCNGYVQFVIKRDREKIFKFASLQSDYGQAFLQKYNLNTKQFDSIILQEENTYFTESTAGLKILSELKGFGFIRLFLYLPTFSHNFFYKLIAKNRYKLFGKTDSCWMPTPELQERFL
ncbi:MAG: thiol-disulfide oxidoreductase DCC family protein [Flavobacteriales bacterium]